LEFAKKIYNFVSTEFMTFSSKKNKDAVNLRFGLIAFAARGMVEKSFGHSTLHVELPKRVYIWRFEVHRCFSTQSSPQTDSESRKEGLIIYLIAAAATSSKSASSSEANTK